jgi:hypothetical protein
MELKLKSILYSIPTKMMLNRFTVRVFRGSNQIGTEEILIPSGDWYSQVIPRLHEFLLADRTASIMKPTGEYVNWDPMQPKRWDLPMVDFMIPSQTGDLITLLLPSGETMDIPYEPKDTYQQIHDFLVNYRGIIPPISFKRNRVQLKMDDEVTEIPTSFINIV